jgi:hypothetical protein
MSGGVAMGTAWELRLLEDALHGGGMVDLSADRINRIAYVAHGAIVVDGAEFGDDTAWHGRGAARLVAGPHGAAVWRYELAPAGAPLVGSSGGRTLEKLRRRLSSVPPAKDGLLMRCDSVAFPPGGCAYLHTHQGPGIRCLIEGGIRIDTEGRSTSYAPGGAWFEGGPDPVFAQAAADRPSRFVRVMLLPGRLLGQSSIHYVRDEDRAKPKSQRYRSYVDAPIALD